MTALEKFNAGELNEAIALATEQIRARPTDAGARVILAELLCFVGEFERADSQLDTASDVDPTTAVAVGQLRQVIRADVARHDFYASGRVPSFVSQPTEEMRLRLEAALLLRENRAGEAGRRLAQAEELRVAVNGHCDGVAFNDLRDGDDLLGSILEVLAGDGQYYWVSFDQVAAVKFDPPRRPRDLTYRTARLHLHSGTEGTVFIPVLYHGSATAERLALRLGRETEWTPADDGPVRGIGQRVLLAGDRDCGVLELGSVTLSPAPVPTPGGPA